MKVDILYITYNRIHSTKLTLPKLIQSTSYPFSLTIVDNKSSDTTASYLKEVVSNYGSERIIKLILNNKNEGLSKPTNAFWKRSEADLVGKIDNDILVEDGWLEKLVNAHEKIPDLSVIGGFHFPRQIFNYNKCKHNIYQYDDIQVLRQPYIGGNYIAKRNIILETGFLKEGGVNQFKLGGWTGYQQKLSDEGYIIGYYYPLIYFKHIHNSSEAYFKEVRGMSRRKYLRWEKKDGKWLLNRKWDW